MQVNYIKIYRDELKSDLVFDNYCSMDNAVILENEDAVVFYTVNINDVPSEYLIDEE
jgi:hypothetical protein